MDEDDGIFWPERDWGDDEQVTDPVPLVLISSRDGRGDPPEVGNRSASWRTLAAKATAAGWTCSVTYALAWTADAYGKTTGTIKAAAHHTHSVVVRLQRGAERAYCAWHCKVKDDPSAAVPAAGWKFQHGAFMHQFRLLNATEFKGALT